jgi:flagellar FliL protein
MAKSAPKKEDSAGEAKPRKSKRKLMVVLVAVVVLLAGGAAAALLVAKKGGDAGHEQAATHSRTPPVFVNLEPFTVNLQTESGEQYLQAVATLRLADKGVEDNIKTYMPEMRHRILLILSGKKASEISSPEGRELLANEIRTRANEILTGTADHNQDVSAAAKGAEKGVAPTAHAASKDDPIQGVLFTSFIVQ